jgi:hypothetical protein
MKLNTVERLAMNNPLRAAHQHHREARWFRDLLPASGRPRVSRIAAVLLSAFCLLSVLFGLFDGDLIDNVSSDGFFSVAVAWAAVLLVATAVVGCSR